MIHGNLSQSTPQDVLRAALARWPGRIALLTSFQAGGMALLDMAWRTDPKVRVKTLDTGRLPQETYHMIEIVRDRYGVDVEVYFPNAQAVEALVRGDGPNGFYHSLKARRACCHIRKVEPLRRALADVDAWVSGLRRSQSATRSGVSKVAVDHAHGGRVKVSPLADWTDEEVEAYNREHDVPRHPLYARGYTSIGCAPCTRPTRPGEDPRAGRWWWEDEAHKECGLHPPGFETAADVESKHGHAALRIVA